MDPRHETQVERDGTRTSRVFAAWAGLIGRRPRWLILAVLAVSAVLAGGLSRLGFDSFQDTMVSG